MDEWDPIPLSRLAHAGYCMRRAALLTNEQIWEESADTAKGRLEHARVHTQGLERRGSEIRLYEHTVYSRRWNMAGKCDCIEGHEDASGCRIPDVPFPVRLYPVEYKHGKLRQEEEYSLQLCAQAMCLEEMYDTVIEEGAIFFITAHRRQPVRFDQPLRMKVLETLRRLDALRRSFDVPAAEPGARCVRCSLKEQCLPELARSAADYCRAVEKEAMEVSVL